MLALSHQYVGVSTKITSITKEHLSQNRQIVQHAYSLDIKQCPPKKTLGCIYCGSFGINTYSPLENMIPISIGTHE